MATRLSLVRACSYAAALLALTAGVVWAQEALLPARLGSAERTALVQVSALELERVAGAEAPLLREYGSRGAEQARYRQGKSEWQITVHQMQDRSAAYGAFTLLGARIGQAAGERVSLGEAGARTAAGLVFYQGSYLVLVEGSTAPYTFVPLASELAGRGKHQPSLPPLPYYLPQEGLVAGSDCYVLGPLGLARAAPLGVGDWVGFAYGAEVETSRYQVGPQQAQLLLISYPTPQIAAERVRGFFRLFNLNRVGAPAGPLAFAKRKGTLVVFVTGLDSYQEASGLMDRVNYQRELSWSDPGRAYSEEQLLPTLVNIFVGTGLVVLVMMLAGLLFAGLRLLLKEVLPGRLFDRPIDDEILILNLHDRK